MAPPQGLPPPPKRRGRGRPAKSALPTLPPPDDPGLLNEVHAIARPSVVLGRPSFPDPNQVFEPYEGEEDPFEAELSGLEHDELREILGEIERREREALRLYEPLEPQDEFHRSVAGERLLRGGNRGGKTLPAAIECARAVTGQDPHGKYPARDGRFVAVGKDLIHCSKVMWRKLIKPGAFKIVRDPETGKWRAFRPFAEWDIAHEAEAKDAPPLIPRRFVAEIAWENKKDEIPKTVRFSTGWELCFFSSIGAPPQGWDIDAAWFDEEIEHSAWYPETSARLLDRHGRFFWSATPQVGTQVLWDLHVKADEQRGQPDAAVEEFYLNLLENPHISEKAKREFTSKLNEDEYNIRVLGQFALLGSRVYPEFAPRGPHGVPAFEIPHEWTRYIFVDPGRQVCAILFVAVPPPYDPEWGGRVVIYDELYIKKCNAVIFAARLWERTKDQAIYDAVIDHRAGRTTEIASGKTPEEQYSESLRALGWKSVRRGHKFAWASDNVKAGIESVRTGLHLDDEGLSRFVVLRERTPQFQWEAERYSYSKIKGVTTDEPLKVNDHLMDCWRYAAMYNLKYVKPAPRKMKAGYTTEILRRKAEKKARESGWGNSIRCG
jgi:hypothetical protein